MKGLFTLLCLFYFSVIHAQSDSFYLLQPDRVFDGEEVHTGWAVLVRNNQIEHAGAYPFTTPASARIIKLQGTTLLPGLIEGHSHLFLHPYNEVSWEDQVLKESRAERTARAVQQAQATLLAGFTTVRDLGTEGAQYDDAGLKQAIEKGVIAGPRMIVATRAIVAKGSYAPHWVNSDIDLPQGAEEAGGKEELGKVIRSQMSKGADVIKVYADYRYGPNGETRPAFTQEEWKTIIEVASLGGRKVVAHATSAEAMRAAALAGVSTIEHGDDGTPTVFRLMKEKGVALCPTLAAGDAISQYRGWKKDIDPEPIRITAKKKSFTEALQAGVTIVFGGDVGVYTHGDNAREMELMVSYGMKPVEVLRSATSVNAAVFGYANQIGKIQKGFFADIIAVQGDPLTDIKNIRKIVWVMKGGKIVKSHLTE